MRLRWIHGGGWHSYDETDTSFLSTLGYDVVHVRYRLSPVQMSVVDGGHGSLSFEEPDTQATVRRFPRSL